MVSQTSHHAPTQKPRSSCLDTPCSFGPPSEEKKKSQHKALSSTNEADSFKNVRKDGLEFPCLPSAPKEHDSFKSPFSLSTIRFYSCQKNNAWPAPEKVQLLLCWTTQSTSVGLQQHGTEAAIPFLICWPLPRDLCRTSLQLLKLIKAFSRWTLLCSIKGHLTQKIKNHYINGERCRK